MSATGAPAARHVLVVGAGMAGARLAEDLRHRQPDPALLRVTLVGDDPHGLYNRILLSTMAAGTLGAKDIALRPEGWWRERDIELLSRSTVTSLDVDERTARVEVDGIGREIRWDATVLATGATAVVPELLVCADTESGDGDDPADLDAALPDVLPFRTQSDCEAILTAARTAEHAVVIGGGVLGLEAARALMAHGIGVTVVHRGTHLMERQLDAAAGAVLAAVVGRLGAQVRLGRRAVARKVGPDGRGSVVLDDGTIVAADVVVATAGVRPRAELARAAGATVARGIVVDDTLATSVPGLYAIGDCAEHRGVVHGLIQPGWDQAAVLADLLTGHDPSARYEGSAVVTRLKARGVDLAAMGETGVDVHSPEHEVVCLTDPHGGRYGKLVLQHGRVVGALLVGLGESSGAVTQLFDAGTPAPSDRLSLLLGRATGTGAAGQVDLATMPGTTTICRCNSVTKAHLVAAHGAGARDVAALAGATRATTGCGSCAGAVQGLCAWLSSIEPGQTDPAPPLAVPVPTPVPSPVPAPVPGGTPVLGGAPENAPSEGAA